MLKTGLYILNKVSSKSIPKTPFELWTSRKPNLNHFWVWGCPVEVKIYNPLEKKTNPKTSHYFFIRYPDHAKGYRFYYPSRCTKIVESLHAKFLELDVVDPVDSPDEIRVDLRETFSLPLLVFDNSISSVTPIGVEPPAAKNIVDLPVNNRIDRSCYS